MDIVELYQGKLYLLNTDDEIILQGQTLMLSRDTYPRRGHNLGRYRLIHVTDENSLLISYNINPKKWESTENLIESNEVGLISFIEHGKEIFIGVDTLFFSRHGYIDCRYRPVGKQEKKFIDTYAYYLLSTQDRFEHIQ